MELAEYEYLWDHTDAGWVLVRLDDARHMIFNERTRVALLIEDDEVHRLVCAQMLKAGVRVLDRVPPGEFVPG